MKRFKVAATQVDVRHTDVEHNLEIHLQLIAEAAEAGCELIRVHDVAGSVDVVRVLAALRGVERDGSSAGAGASPP